MVDGVGRDLGCVDHDVVHKRAVEEVFEAEVEVGFRAGDGGAEVGLRYPLQPFTLLELCQANLLPCDFRPRDRRTRASAQAA
jgi:hypothetical protein